MGDLQTPHRSTWQGFLVETARHKSSVALSRALLLVWLPNRVYGLTSAALRQQIVQASSAQALAERKSHRIQAELLLAVSQLEEFEPGTCL